MRCQWQDRFGVGAFEVTFAEDMSRFGGWWTTDGGDGSKISWSGAKGGDVEELAPGAPAAAAESLEQMGPMMGNMMASFLEGTLAKLAEPESAERLATFTKNYFRRSPRPRLQPRRGPAPARRVLDPEGRRDVIEAHASGVGEHRCLSRSRPLPLK
ncbi:MAG TPA: hypothetical protein VF017_09750 [Thermoanaerobaculia bacterium]|nr:hypothetical protein [Thermoanaerobaculia bacterium]